MSAVRPSAAAGVNLVRDVPNNRARVEVWENGAFARLCADVDRTRVEDYEFIADARTRPVSLLLRWRLPVRLGAFAVSFAVFKTRAYEPAPGAIRLEYLDGARWRTVGGEPVVDRSEEARDAFYRRLGVRRWIYRLPGVVTHQLRVHLCAGPTPGTAPAPCIVRDLECFERRVVAGGRAPAALRFAGRALERRIDGRETLRIDRSGVDRLGRRVLQGGREPDFESVAAPLYPLDFHKSAIGRADDGNETLVTWNGTLIMVEGADDAAWNHYSEESMASAWRDQLVLIMKGMDRCIDRWFAFAVGPRLELLGSALGRTRQAWIDGFKPGIRTTYRERGLAYAFQAFVEPDRRRPYLNVVEVEIENRSPRRAETAVAVVMGRHASESMHETGNPARGPRFDAFLNPLFCAPHPTGYRRDGSGRLVLNGAGEIMLESSRRGRLGGGDLEPVFTVPLRLAPGAKTTLRFAMPGVAAPARRPSRPGPRALPAFRAHWARTLGRQAAVDTPEARLNDLARNALAQILITLLNRGKLKYGSYWYEEYYGVEEAEAVMALAKYGFAAEAKAAAEMMLSPELLDPNGYHHQYRHGVAAQTAAEVYRLAGDRAWLERIAPRLEAVGRWIVGATRESSGTFAGLLPKRTYGGDISTPARNISTNARCWRGLRDAGLMLAEVGRAARAEVFLAEAARYRQRILRLVRRVTDRSGALPFVPMGLDIGIEGAADYRRAEAAYDSLSRPKMGAYWHVFAAWMLRSGILDPDGAESRWITDYIERRGGLLLGLLRLGKHYTATSVDIDPHYGLGYIQTLLARGERDKFLLSFYALAAHGMSRNTFSSPESSRVFPLRSDPAEWNRAFHETRWNWGVLHESYLSEPLSSGATTVVLSLLRDMLVREGDDGDRRVLHLLSGMPAAWLVPGRRLALERMPTHFGPIRLDAEAPGAGRVRVRLAARWRSRPDEIRLHLHVPDGGRMRDVAVNGRRQAAAGAGVVRLGPAADTFEVEARFG